MKTMKRLMLVLLAVTIPVLTANSSNKKNTDVAQTPMAQTAATAPMAQTAATAATSATNATAPTSATNESVIKVSMPPFKKFVTVIVEESALHRESNLSSPTLVNWYDADCESDLCEQIYQWSDQPGKKGFELDTDSKAGEGAFYPVLDEENDFYRVGTLKEWCEIESAYIPKNEVKIVETAPIKADELEKNKEWFYHRYRVLRDGKYKGVVLCDELDELSGETFSVGLLADGVLLTPVVYEMNAYMNTQQQESVCIQEEDGRFTLIYNKSMDAAGENDFDPRLDLNKLSNEQIAKIVDTVTKKKPEVVRCLYLFPALGTNYFYYNSK